MSESRSERINISLKPSTLAKLERMAKAAGKPTATMATEFLEELEGVMVIGATALEKQNEAKAKSLRKHEQALLKSLKEA